MRTKVFSFSSGISSSPSFVAVKILLLIFGIKEYTQSCIKILLLGVNESLAQSLKRSSETGSSFSYLSAMHYSTHIDCLVSAMFACGAVLVVNRSEL